MPLVNLLNRFSKFQIRCKGTTILLIYASILKLFYIFYAVQPIYCTKKRRPRKADIISWLMPDTSQRGGRSCAPVIRFFVMDGTIILSHKGTIYCW